MTPATTESGIHGASRAPDERRVLALLEQLLPAASAIRIALGPIADHRGDLHALELPAIGRASERRASEFSTGRMLARRAMLALGVPPGPVARDEGRAPRWPESCLGSITHAEGLAAAAVARCGTLTGVGIDLELADRVGAELYPRLFTSVELAELEVVEGHSAREATLRFSAKESVYKAVNPSVGRFIGFHEVEVVLERCGSDHDRHRTGCASGIEAGRFRLRYVGDHAPNRIMETGSGCYCFFGQYVFSLFIIP